MGLFVGNIPIQRDYKKRATVKLGIDLDGVLVDSVIPVTTMAEMNTGIKAPEGERDWYFSNYPKVLRDEIFRLFKDPKFMCNCMTFHGVVPTLMKWKDAEHKVHIITARAPEIRNETEKMVSSTFYTGDDISGRMLYDGLHFVDIHEPKTEVLRRLSVDMFIDDSPHRVKEACQLGIPRVYLVHNKYTSTYNECVIGKLPVTLIKVISDIIL